MPDQLTLGTQSYAVILAAEHGLGSLTLTLDRPLVVPNKPREPLLSLRLGSTVEPVRLASIPDGCKVTVRRVY